MSLKKGGVVVIFILILFLFSSSVFAACQVSIDRTVSSVKNNLIFVTIKVNVEGDANSNLVIREFFPNDFKVADTTPQADIKANSIIWEFDEADVNSLPLIKYILILPPSYLKNVSVHGEWETSYRVERTQSSSLFKNVSDEYLPGDSNKKLGSFIDRFVESVFLNVNQPSPGQDSASQTPGYVKFLVIFGVLLVLVFVFLFGVIFIDLVLRRRY